MTDQPGSPPEERLPAPRPSSAPVPAERFSAPLSAHRNDLTPERAGRIVRQSANARWVGFIAVTVVALFVIGYYFWELGLPGGLSEPRLDQAAHEQQVTAVERGYNLYQANCAQCHGVNGLGPLEPSPGVGPALNRQDKLFAHLNPEYLRNILNAGGRYACGNPDSIMPVWANTGSPPGPLNYKEIDYLIAFIRAEQGTGPYRVLDPELLEPTEDPVTGEEQTIEPWVDPAWTPAPNSTPYPNCWEDEFITPGGSAAPPGEGTGDIIEEVALGIKFLNQDLQAPADESFRIEFDNQDTGIQHNIEIKDEGGASVFKGAIFPGPEVQTYQVPALAAGTYPFICTVHPSMTGTLSAGG